MWSRVAVGVLAVAVGIGVGGAIGFAAHRGPAPGIFPQPPRGTERSTPNTTDTPRPAQSRSTVGDTMLAWTYGALPPGLARSIARLPGVAHVVPVVGGTMWLTRSYAPNGTLIDRAPRGMAFPLELAAATPSRYAPFLTPSDRVFLPELAHGRALLGTTSAELRRLGAGGLLKLGAHRVRVAGVVPDASIGASEVFVSRVEAARLGVTDERYLLIDPRAGASEPKLASRIRALLPQGTPLRIRGPGQTTFLRRGDAVLAPAILKEDFGEFAARPAPDGFLDVDQRWESSHIVDARVPILGHVRCNRAIVPQLRGALGEIQHNGLSQLIDVSQYAGCYVAKFQRNRPGAIISHHTWGIAIDLNVGSNPFGHTPHMDPRVVAIFERWGFIWGGQFLVPDGMHFEFVRFSSGG